MSSYRTRRHAPQSRVILDGGSCGSAGRVLAAEPAAVYEAAGPDVCVPPAPVRPSDAVEVAVPDDGLSRSAARLVELGDLLDAADRAIARAVGLLIDLHASGDEVAAGLPLELWLSQVARRIGTDARMLTTAADVLARMPATLTGFRDGRLSWGQVRVIVARVRRLSHARQGEVDRLLAGLVDEFRACEPDRLVELVDEHVDRLRPSELERAERQAERGEFVALTPRLFGGGTIFADLGTEVFATVAEALDPPVTEVQGQRRETEPVWKARGRARAARLHEMADHYLAGTGGGGRARPKLLATIDVDALLDESRTPGWLLHTLTGGRMKASSELLRRITDQRGALLRLIVVDDTGHAVGVGHQTRVPPDWLREAIWATTTRDQAPGSDTPVRRCDLDHADPWRDDGTGGPTDAINLHPIGRGAHTAKTDRHWTIRTRPDGTRTWTHTSGLTVTIPAPRRRLDRAPPDT